MGRREGLLKTRGDGHSAWRNLMRKQLSTTVFATLFLALTAGLAVGQTPPLAASPSSVIKVAEQTTTPPRISATGRHHRSQTASTRGANARGFCPPWPEKETRSGKCLPLLKVSAVYGAFGAVHHTTRNARVTRCSTQVALPTLRPFGKLPAKEPAVEGWRDVS